MLRSTRALILLVIVCLLFTACGSSSSNTTNKKNQNPTQDVCPNQAKMISPACVTPHALSVAYGIDPLIQKGFTGKGQTIVDITSFDSPNLQKNLKVFDQTFNLPPIDVQVISPLNEPMSDPNKDQQTWAQGTEREVEILHAIAPGAKIVVLESPVAETEGTFGLPEFRKLVQYAIDKQLGNVVSLRWDVSELTLQDAAGQQEVQQWNDLLQNGTTNHHITYFATSGSSGATDYVDNTHMGNVPTTSFPANSPWVTSVGGTNLNLTNTNSILAETAWSGSGGGFTHLFPMPSYQKLLPAQVQQQFNNQRGVPDVSIDDDPLTGLAVYVDGQWQLAGGNTNVPVWTALGAIADQIAGHPLGFINPALYKLGTSNTYHQDFHDIIEGNNNNQQANVQGYSAAPGWDAVTGLGTPNAQTLIPDLIKAT
ncbi:MAG TPA: S53 family peptidase [Ktedonobacteraceae bacterium]